ncbi:ABC transporter ATP-binding protein [Dialister sp.]|jgi:peptide/nickel transport system ATP-binding protein|uniref:ABC transporter ATP-binding protein n=1 Tax=Dialister sp. TaxID=1955814 RepID=UPI002E8157A1|nr:ABC transporter ATP-binding protein [Dialister sp.]MEE3453758.1 ABC transporter ATP-binding protein [Dialister sp.]
MLLEVKDLGISYGKRDPVVRHVTFNLEQGKILAIVGESGSGKTTVIRAIQHVLPGGGHISEGQALLEGQDTELKTPEMHRKLSGTDVSMIFQDSGAMMNPIRLIGDQFREFLAIHGMTDEKEAHDRMIEMLTMVRLPDPEQILKSYTFELSGGMRQRVGIAMAMAFHPKLLLADEPTSALDVTTQAAIVKEMMEVRKKMNTSIIIVTHNMGVACFMADDIMVMRNGNVVEYGKAEDVIYHPKEDYTKMLLAAVPTLEGEFA